MSLLSPQLQAFIAIVTHKTVHAAAGTLHLTQTAVTQRLKLLEASLSTTLFIRSRRGMCLTPEGEALFHYCQTIQALEGETLARIQGTGIQTPIQIRITGPSAIMHTRILKTSRTLLQQFPQLLFYFLVNDAENRHLTLKAAECDLAVIQPQDLAPEMNYKELRPEEYVLVCTAKWQHRPLKEILHQEKVIDYEPNDTVTLTYLKQYKLFEKALNLRHFVNRIDLLAELVCQGIGYTTLAKEFALPYVKNNKLMLLNEGKTYAIPQILAWYDRPEPPRYWQAIIEAIN